MSCDVKKICKLDEVVVNRIAAGEVVQRPCNAIKELIENSIDAGSTSITVTVDEGGLKFLQISDNGHGIRKDDLGIVCERFTTSKLKSFADLRSIATHGFRGEALASISHVSNLSIQTRTASEKCAWVAHYIDGKPVAKKPGGSSDPRPTAGNVGTTITAEDLFYNMVTRRRALNGRDELTRIAHVITCYALHNSHISFALRKQGDSTPRIKTAATEDRTKTAASLYGPVLGKELLPFSCEDRKFGFRSTGLLSNANFSGKTFRFVLFINGRLVESVGARKAFEAVYASLLPRGSHPWVYLALEVDPGNVDVNVHPTKKEVHFLHEEAILVGIQAKAQQTLYTSTTSRNYYTQAKLPCVDVAKEVKETRGKENTAPYDYQLVRTDVNQQKLDIFLSDNKTVPPAGKVPVHKPSSSETGSAERPVSPVAGPSGEGPVAESVGEAEEPTVGSNERVPVFLTSVLQLQEAICKARHEGSTEMFRDSTFVGVASERLALVQVRTKLYLMDFSALSRSLVYQKVLFDFRNMAVFRLSEGACLRELVLLALGQSESGWRPEHGSKEELAELAVKLLVSKREMLADYFSLEISAEGELRGLPVVMEKYPPLLQRLPLFLLRLSTEVEWGEEKGCFKGIASEIGHFYTLTQPAEGDPNVRDWKFTLENVLWPQLRTVYIPDEGVTSDGTVLQVADLHNLYKVFERC